MQLILCIFLFAAAGIGNELSAIADWFSSGLFSEKRPPDNQSGAQFIANVCCKEENT